MVLKWPKIAKKAIINVQKYNKTVKIGPKFVQ